MGKRPQPRLRINALTGEWRNGEAGEGRGSELCEPGGLRHQAGGASWRAPHQDPVGRISPGPTRWPPGAERRLVPAKSNLKPQTFPPPLPCGRHVGRQNQQVCVSDEYSRKDVWCQHRNQTPRGGEPLGDTPWHRVKTSAGFSMGADLGMIRTPFLQLAVRSSGSAHSHTHRQG